MCPIAASRDRRANFFADRGASAGSGAKSRPRGGEYLRPGLMMGSVRKVCVSWCRVDDCDLLNFVRMHVPSAWTLDLLLLLHRDPQSSWSCEALVRELRGALELVMQNLGVLVTAGLVAETDDGGYAYRPSSSDLAAAVDGLARLYARKPVTVRNAIFAPSG